MLRSTEIEAHIKCISQSIAGKYTFTDFILNLFPHNRVLAQIEIETYMRDVVQ
jgi:hypothetical protein